MQSREIMRGSQEVRVILALTSFGLAGIIPIPLVANNFKGLKYLEFLVNSL